MTDQDKREQQDDQQEQADLEVSEEQAEEVQGGMVKIGKAPDKDPQLARVKF